MTEILHHEGRTTTVRVDFENYEWNGLILSGTVDVEVTEDYATRDAPAGPPSLLFDLPVVTAIASERNIVWSVPDRYDLREQIASDPTIQDRAIDKAMGNR